MRFDGILSAVRRLGCSRPYHYPCAPQTEIALVGSSHVLAPTGSTLASSSHTHTPHSILACSSYVDVLFYMRTHQLYSILACSAHTSMPSTCTHHRKAHVLHTHQQVNGITVSNCRNFTPGGPPPRSSLDGALMNACRQPPHA
jgi:hypothetical protein